MTENLREQFLVLPENLSNHLLITLIPLAIGVAVSLPLAVYVVKHPRLRYPTLTVVSIVQTIPSLALLALMVPVLAALSSLTARAMGVEISALGFYPTVIALTLYSMLPMVRNAVTGILGVDPAMVEAAEGVGMTPGQVLWKVELPLAAPVIIAGIRTATVWVVGIATLATPVGQRCLGNYIFRGLQTRNWTAVVFGCVAAALLAILLDLLLGAVEKAVKERRRRLAMGAAAALLLIMATGILAPFATGWFASRAEQQETGGTRQVVWVGSKTFTEQYILATLITRVLEEEGFPAREKESLGSTVVFDALVKGEIDCYVDYTGTIWANYMNRERTAGAKTVLQEVREWLRAEHGIQSLGALGFENAYGLAMPKKRARELGIETIGDLAGHASGMKIGGDYEFFGRPEWQRIRDTYGLRFADQISYDSTFMYRAVRRGQVDVISAFTSDGRIEAFGLAVLEDPEDTIPPYDAVLLLSGDAAARHGLAEALDPLIGAIPVQLMRRANYKVDREKNKLTVDQSAEWLYRQLFEERDGSS
jgi:osmoprotectant transport system permease protein